MLMNCLIRVLGEESLKKRQVVSYLCLQPGQDYFFKNFGCLNFVCFFPRVEENCFEILSLNKQHI